MRFKDLPKLTSVGYYTVNAEWDFFIKDWIPRQMEKENLSLLDLDPDFQRAHVWTEEQQISYIEFILKGGWIGKDIYFNHPGWMGSFMGDFVIVDGKQRIEAVRRFIYNEIKAFDTLYKDFEGRLPENNHFVIHINNLKTRKEVLQWYLEFNTGGIVHTEEELDKVRNLLTREK